MKKYRYLIYDVNGERVYKGDTVEQMRSQVIQVEGSIFENFTWVLSEFDDGVPQWVSPDEKIHCAIGMPAPFKLIKRGAEL